MARELSAKDKAFEKERQKFRREIAALKDRIRYLEIELEKETHLKNYNEELLEDMEKEFQSHYNMSSEEFMQHVERERKCSEALAKFSSLGKALGGMY